MYKLGKHLSIVFKNISKEVLCVTNNDSNNILRISVGLSRGRVRGWLCSEAKNKFRGQVEDPGICSRLL